MNLDKIKPFPCSRNLLYLINENSPGLRGVFIYQIIKAQSEISINPA